MRSIGALDDKAKQSSTQMSLAPAMDAEPAATGEPPPSSSGTAALPAGKGLGDKATRDMPPR